MGHLVEVTRERPKNWWPSVQCEIDESEWIGFVRWLPEIPFSASGDSGSLVYTIKGGTFIPLGIHIGAPSARFDHSCFVSLETYCLEAEAEG